MMMDAGLDNAGHDTGRRDSTGDNAPHPGEASNARDRAEPDMPDPRKLAQDWVTLWQSELSAMAADPEVRESWQTVMAVWAGTMAAMIRGLPRDPNASRHDEAYGRARPPDASRATPAAAAPDARDAEIDRLARHVAALEHRLAELELGGNPPVHPAGGSGRTSRR